MERANLGRVGGKNSEMSMPISEPVQIARLRGILTVCRRELVGFCEENGQRRLSMTNQYLRQ
jgi:hypothetical protein